MSQYIKLIDETSDEKQQLREDIRLGLSQTDKQIQSKYYYDEVGSELFNQITRHPDYYLTGCELEILRRYKEDISTRLGSETFNLIDLGPGEGIKTGLLIEQFINDNRAFTYVPIDISRNFLDHVIDRVSAQFSGIETIALNSDYLVGMEWLMNNCSQRNVVLFLGSSIGNFDLQSTAFFLDTLRTFLHQGDYVLIGFDLRKDIDILMKAYNDSDGLTREFNLNLLKRINHDLHGHFNVDAFYHYGTYNVHTGAMESYLLSLEEQTVDIDDLNTAFTFRKFEPIHVETSYKYLRSQVEKLAADARFKIVKNYTDHRGYFINSLWQAN